MEPNIIQIEKNARGEQCIRTRIRRNHEGLSINIWAHPKVEAFMKAIGTGDIMEVRAMARYWVGQTGEDAKPLACYHMANDGGLTNIVGRKLGSAYRLDKPGDRLLFHDEYDCINMSFLRLVGISEAEGVTFSVKGVYTTEMVQAIAKKIEDASRALYQEFLKPVDMYVLVSTQEMP